jgi:hypothetical protein
MMIRRTFGSAAAQVKPRYTNLLIDGKFVPATGNKTFDTFNPATEASLFPLRRAVACRASKFFFFARRASSLRSHPWRVFSSGGHARFEWECGVAKARAGSMRWASTASFFFLSRPSSALTWLSTGEDCVGRGGLGRERGPGGRCGSSRV